MDQWTEKLDVYLDGELTADEMRAVQEHVRNCPSCAAEVLSRVQMKRAVQTAAANRFKVNTEFREKVRSQIALRPRFGFSHAWAIAAGTAVLVSFVLYIGYQRQIERRRVFGEIADLHVSTLASANPVDVISTDRHTVKPWFQGKLPFTFNLPELQNSDFALVGGKVVYAEQSPGAELIYQIRKHQISVFIFQERAFPAALREGIQRQTTFNTESWSANGLRYFVIGDASAQDVDNLAILLKEAAQP
ncbi:MAG TPA: zf-HC2 domain-containing protein [Terriglobales bacterium]